MRTSLSIQTLYRSINVSLFSSKTQSLNIPFHGFVLHRTKLGKVRCLSLSNSDRLHSSPAIFSANLEKGDESGSGNSETSKEKLLKLKSESLGIAYDDSCVPGRFYNLLCPKCEGGKSMERSLSFYIALSGDMGMWRCFRLDCGWAGRVYADTPMKRRIRSSDTLTEEYLRLFPPSDKIIAYFRDRMISEETVRRNRIMQFSEDTPVIAFPFRRKGVLVSCKYRALEKKFWREKDTEKIFYGLDDIADADEIIIVEGEIDKLSVEEAGLRNCVSVPDGAPMKTTEVLPPPEMDVQFEYVWTCKQYLDKASRIILATDADKPGRTLARELARRLGKDRCWQVKWPMKDENSSFKDANEVLTQLGPSALKNLIENAEPYSESTALDKLSELKIESLFSIVKQLKPERE